MDPRLLGYYNQELQHLREMGAEFAREFPKIAARLGMDGIEVSDPYVERLLEGVGFLAARVQLKIDAQFPRFTQRLLESVYPNYLAPTPSMAVVELEADLNDGNLARGVLVPRGSAMRKLRAGQPRAEQGRDHAPIEFRTAQDVTLWPLEVTAAEYFSYAPDLPLRAVPVADAIRGGLRFRVRSTAGLTFNLLALDRLRLYFSGSQETAYRLYELTHGAAVGVLVTPAQQPKPWHVFFPAEHVKRAGYADDEALLPASLRMFQGHRLLQEYYGLPERFLFTDLDRIGAGVRRHSGKELEIAILFSRGDPALEKVVDKKNVALNCTPAINLFPRRADRILVSDTSHRFHVVPDRTQPLDYEVFEVTSVTGFGAGAVQHETFRPFYADYDADSSPHQAYFTLDREPRLLSESQKRNGFRSSYVGSEVFVTLVDAAHAPYRQDLRQLAVETLCTNRDLPLLMPLGAGETDFTLEAAAPVRSIRVVRGPSRPYSPVLAGGAEWRLVNLLTLNYLSLQDASDQDGAAALRDMLQLYAASGDPAVGRQIEGVRSVSVKPVVRRLPGGGPITFGRGLRIAVDVDELAFQGGSAFLFGCVLERFFARHVSINSFTETALASRMRGEIHRWGPQWGTRPIL